MAEHSIINDNITDHEASHFQELNGKIVMIEARGYGQHYTQQNELFYFISGQSVRSKIYRYDLFTNNIPSEIPTTSDYSCIASYKKKLYIIGGYLSNEYIKELQIHGTQSKIWALGPYLLQSRRGHVCIIEPTSRSLYVVGSLSDPEHPSESIEKLLINDASDSWFYLHSSLLYPVIQTRLVSHKGEINIIQSINTSTEEFDVFGDMGHPAKLIAECENVMDHDNLTVYLRLGTICYSVIIGISVYFNYQRLKKKMQTQQKQTIMTNKDPIKGNAGIESSYYTDVLIGDNKNGNKQVNTNENVHQNATVCDEFYVETIGNDQILSMVKDNSLDSEKLYDQIFSIIAKSSAVVSSILMAVSHFERIICAIMICVLLIDVFGHDINHDVSSSWYHLHSSLLYPVIQTGLVSHTGIILVIDGFYLDEYINRTYVDKMQSIDASTYEVDIFAVMVYPEIGIKSVTVHDILYMFGGLNHLADACYYERKLDLLSHTFLTSVK